MYDNRLIGVYWDFENLHASLLDHYLGWGEYSKRQRSVQDVIVQLDPIMAFAASLGTVVINRAYANWGYFHRYRSSIQAHSIELVQVFPSSGSKNGADISLAVDVIDDLHQHKHLTDIVLVGGDSDFIAVAQRCRRLGKSITGIGVEGTVPKPWLAACSSFRFYQQLDGVQPPTPESLASDSLPPSAELAHVRRLLVEAFQRLRPSEDGWQLLAQLGAAMRRTDPTFAVSPLGGRSLLSICGMCNDLVELKTVNRNGDDHPAVRLRSGVSLESVASTTSVVSPSATNQDTTGDADTSRVRALERVLDRLGGILLPPRRILWATIRSAPSAFGRHGNVFANWPEVDAALRTEVAAVFPDVSLADCRRVRRLLYSSRQFKIDTDVAVYPEQRKISLEATPAAMAEAVARLVVERLASATYLSVTPEDVFVLLFAETENDRKDQWVASLSKMSAEVHERRKAIQPPTRTETDDANWSADRTDEATEAEDEPRQDVANVDGAANRASGQSAVVVAVSPEAT